MCIYSIGTANGSATGRFCCSALKCVTWFLKEKFLTGSSAARLMLLSRMKKRMRLVKMLWLTILWHMTLNLRKRRGRDRRSEEEGGSVKL